MSLIGSVIAHYTHIPEEHLTTENIEKVVNINAALQSAKPAVENWITTEALKLDGPKEQEIAERIGGRLNIAADTAAELLKLATEELAAFAVGKVEKLLPTPNATPAPNTTE